MTFNDAWTAKLVGTDAGSAWTSPCEVHVTVLPLDLRYVVALPSPISSFLRILAVVWCRKQVQA